MVRCILHLSTLLLVASATTRARADDAVPRPLDAATAVRLAVERSDIGRATSASAEATRAAGDAESRLPDPEVMAEAWQVPLSRPYALGDAGMVAVWIRQTLPAPGVRARREAGREAEARASLATGRDRLRLLARDAAHAFVDLQSAEVKRASHVAHRDVAARLVTLARARLGTPAGRLTDVTQAEVERARLEADVAVEGAMVLRATARLNGLLRRPDAATIEPTPLPDPETVASTTSPTAALPVAESNRGALAASRARREAGDAMRDAARREAAVPSFTVGAGWFAPTAMMPFHGYGLSVGATLPWIWGGARARARASEAESRAATHELAEGRAEVRTEVAAAFADVHAAALRVAVLSARAKPAADAGLEAALVAYQSGQGDAAALFRAEKDVVEVDVAIVEARTMLAHALVDVDAAVGAPVPRARLDVQATAAAFDSNHGHGRTP